MLNRAKLICLLAFAPATAIAHHGSAFYYDLDNMITIEGEILAVSWRNPHVKLQVRGGVAGGDSAIWDVESASPNGLQRVGIESDVVAIGERVSLSGALSRTGKTAMAAFLMVKADGTQIPIWPQRAAIVDQEVQLAEIPAAVAEASRREARGIFRVWSRTGMQGQLLAELEPDLPFNDTARAAQAAWNPLTDDPVLQCTPRGLPSLMNNPQPMEFIDQGDTLLMRLEEWDGRRTIHMTVDAIPENLMPSRYGYSIGRWEGRTLVVQSTGFSDPNFDDHGTPQGESASMVERFTLSEDETRLDYEVIHTDPLIFTEPARLTGRWAWTPGEEVKDYNCFVQ